MTDHNIKPVYTNTGFFNVSNSPMQAPTQIDDLEKMEYVQLKALIDFLLQHQFQQLVFLLYRLDIDETALKYLLTENKDSASVIADAIVQRLAKTKATREHFKQNNTSISDEERW